MFLAMEDCQRKPMQLDMLDSSHLSDEHPLDPGTPACSPPPTPPSVLPVFTDVGVVPEQEEQQQFEMTVADLQGEVSALRTKQKHLDAKRREALNRILDVKGSIRVFCRVRSPLAADKGRFQTPVLAGSEKISVLSSGGRKDFALDKVFSQQSTQEDVFTEVEPILRSALDGHNVCVLAYGQTGTGKTFTMEGTGDKPGIVPRAMKEIFSLASEENLASSSFTFSLSMLEVYMGSLSDLLAQKNHTNKGATLATKSHLNIRTGCDGSVEVEGLTDVPVEEFKQAHRWYARGRRARSTSWTSANEASSRSHCLTRITIARGSEAGVKTSLSKLWMVDLGGSERLLKTGATGQTMDEGKAINLSLSSLGDVISALKRKRGHVPYRNSKLTQILSDSLGDGSKVLMVVHVSPSEDDAGETVCSLNFAKRARASESTREITEDSKLHREELIAEFNRQIKEYDGELRNVRKQIQVTEDIVRERMKILEDRKCSSSPRSPLVLDSGGDAMESPRSATDQKPAAGRNTPCPLPRFMTSTACSRQRLMTAASSEWNSSRSRASRSMNRSSVDFLASQARSFSDPHRKPNSQNKQLMKCQGHRIKELSSSLSLNFFNCRSVDSNPLSTPRNGKLSTSHAALRVTFGQHQRRMSNFV